MHGRDQTTYYHSDRFERRSLVAIYVRRTGIIMICDNAWDSKNMPMHTKYEKKSSLHLNVLKSLEQILRKPFHVEVLSQTSPNVG